MTIIPLVAALLVLGIVQIAEAARAGATARRFLVLVFAVLAIGGLFTILAMPVVLQRVPGSAGC